MFEKIISLNLKRQTFRKLAQIGALEVMGYPIENLDYEPAIDCRMDFEKFVKHAARVFDFFKKLSGIDAPDTASIIAYGYLKMIRKVIEKNKPMLLMEDDTFLTIKYDTLLEKLDDLNRVVDDAEIILLSGYYDFEGDTQVSEPEAIDDFWGRGGHGTRMWNSSAAVIYTPTGAQRLMDYYRTCEPEGFCGPDTAIESAGFDPKGVYGPLKPMFHFTALQGRGFSEFDHSDVIDEKHAHIKMLRRFGIKEQ